MLADLTHTAGADDIAQAITDTLVAHAPPADDATLTTALLQALPAPTTGSAGDRLDAAITTLLQRHGIDTQTVLGEDVAAALLQHAQHKLSTL
jgi:hypothetical protein